MYKNKYVICIPIVDVCADQLYCRGGVLIGVVTGKKLSAFDAEAGILLPTLVLSYQITKCFFR